MPNTDEFYGIIKSVLVEKCGLGEAVDDKRVKNLSSQILSFLERAIPDFQIDNTVLNSLHEKLSSDHNLRDELCRFFSSSSSPTSDFLNRIASFLIKKDNKSQVETTCSLNSDPLMRPTVSGAPSGSLELPPYVSQDLLEHLDEVEVNQLRKITTLIPTAFARRWGVAPRHVVQSALAALVPSVWLIALRTIFVLRCQSAMYRPDLAKGLEALEMSYELQTPERALESLRARGQPGPLPGTSVLRNRILQAFVGAAVYPEGTRDRSRVLMRAEAVAEDSIQDMCNMFREAGTIPDLPSTPTASSSSDPYEFTPEWEELVGAYTLGNAPSGEGGRVRAAISDSDSEVSRTVFEDIPPDVLASYEEIRHQGLTAILEDEEEFVWHAGPPHGPPEPCPSESAPHPSQTHIQAETPSETNTQKDTKEQAQLEPATVTPTPPPSQAQLPVPTRTKCDSQPRRSPGHSRHTRAPRARDGALGRGRPPPAMQNVADTLTPEDLDQLV